MLKEWTTGLHAKMQQRVSLDSKKIKNVIKSKEYVPHP